MKLINKFKKSVEMKSAIAYTFSSVFSRGLAIITVPIFTRIMTTEQIGVVNLYNSWYSMISVIATLALTSGGFAVAMKEYEGRRDEYQSSILSLTSIIALMLVLFYLVFSDYVIHITGLPAVLIWLMLVGFLFAPARDFWLARQRYEYKYKLSSFVTIVSAIIASVLSVVVVISAGKSNANNTAEYRLFANYLVLYGVAAIIWISIMVKGKTFYHKEFWKKSLMLSLPLVGYNVAAQILNVSDKMMISKMVNNSAVGIYGTLFTVSSLSLMVWQAINSSFIPYLFRNIENKGSNIKRLSFELIFAYACVAILLTMLAPEIVYILAPKEYFEAIYIMPPVAAGIFFTSLSQLYSNISVYYKKTKYVMYPAILAAIVNVILNAVFIPKFGYMAAAYTTLFSYALWAYIQIALANYTSKVCGKITWKIYDDKRIILLSLGTVLLSLSGLLLYKNIVCRYLFILIIGLGTWKAMKKVMASSRKR